MTNQEIYDKVKRHLMRQKRPAMDGKRCVYRNADGLRCAVGCLIPKNLYKPKYESWVMNAIIAEIGPRVGIGEESLDLLGDLQIIHDGADSESDPVAFWRSELPLIANRFGLDP